MNPLEEMRARRSWFDSYLNPVCRTVVDTVGGPRPMTEAESVTGDVKTICGMAYTCPCCGYPTLTERAGYDICSLCNWQDDGQDDEDAEKVLGGPNRDYSLAEARLNFQAFHIMFRLGQDPRVGGADNAAEKEAKASITAAFNRMCETDDPYQQQSCEIVMEGFRILQLETRRRIGEYERRFGNKP